MKIKTEDLQIILSWIRGNKIFSNEINEWDGLLIRISLYKEEFIDIDDTDFERILIDVTKFSDKIKNIDLLDSLDNPLLKSLDIDNNLIRTELERMQKLTDIVDDLIISNDFVDLGLNKNKIDLLEKRLKTYINNEEYEKCVDLVKEIDTMKNHLTKA